MLVRFQPGALDTKRYLRVIFFVARSRKRIDPRAAAPEEGAEVSSVAT